tara:strand:- start:419 stop:598 length:180 start_codon:yes stop_codon:yes gene_type:complete
MKNFQPYILYHFTFLIVIMTIALARKLHMPLKMALKLLEVLATLPPLVTAGSAASPNLT